jgi:hypothetical protein
MENIMKYLLLGSLSLLLFVACSRNDIAGNSSQAGNPSVTAMVYNPGGSPAAHARVRFYPVHYNPRTGMAKALAAVVESTTTDANGNYSAKLDTGAYNVLSASDSGVVYQDSITVVKDSTVHPPADTLKAPGGIRGRVRLQTGDDARTVFIIFMGTSTLSMPDDSIGRFTVANMAGGTYRVRILTTLDAYVPKDTMLSVMAGKTDSLTHDIVLQYTGIPVVTGLTISYDTLKQIVNLSWNKPTTGRAVKGYNIYRMNVDSNTTLATINLHLVTDTVYSDSTGTQDQTYKYSVAVMDTNNTEGVKSATVSVIKVSAYPLITTINLDSSGPGPIALAIAPDATLYVAYRGNGDGFVGMYDKTGHLLRKVGAGMFTQVFDAAIDSRKNIYVADPDKGRIVKFNASGDSSATWTTNVPTSLAIDVSDIIYAVTSNGQEIITFDTAGNRKDSLVAPASNFGLIRASHTHQGIWVGDHNSGNIKHYQPNLALIGTLTITQGPIGEPSGLRGVDDSDFCYVSEYQRPVFVFDAAATLKSWWSPGIYECLALSDKAVCVIIQNGLGWRILTYSQPQ